MSGSDLSDPLCEAATEALKANVGVAALVSGRVYDYVPSDRTYPYLRCSAPFTTPWEATGGVSGISGGTTRLQVDAFAQGYSRRDAGRLCKAVVDALKNTELALAEGYAVYVQWLQTQVIPDPVEQGRFRGIIEFEALAAE